MNNTYDFKSLLSLDGLRETDVIRVTRTAFYPDGTVDIRYSGVPYGALSGASDWLYKNRLTLQDAEIAAVKLEGLWRTVTIQEQPVVERGVTIGVTLVQRLAKGYYTNMDWRAVRLSDGANGSGNSNTISGVSGASSALYRRYVTLTMPYIDPAHVERVVAGITATSYEDLVVAGNVKLSGVWFKLGVTHKLEEDNTSSVLITLAKPVFTVTGYRGAGSWGAEDRYYVTEVPLQIAQTVINDWKSGKVNASGGVEGVNHDKGTCNIVLSVNSPTEKIDQIVETTIDCASTITESLDLNKSAAGTTPAAETAKRKTVTSEATQDGKFNVKTRVELSKPQDLAVPEYRPDIDHIQKDETHLHALPTELANFLAGTFPRSTHGIDFTETDDDAMRGVRRRITVDINPDCTLHLRGESNEPASVGDELDPDIGETYTTLNTLGLYWNQTKAEIEAILDTLAAQEVGKVKQVQIQRNDLGRFDMTVTVKTHTAFTASLTTSGAGIQVEAKAGINSTAATALTAGIRESVDISLEPDEKGQVNWKTVKRTAVETAGTPISTTGDGIQLEVTAHKNRDPGEVTTLGEVGPRERLSADLSVGDDGSQDVKIQKQTVVKTTGSFTAGNKTLHYGKNADVADLPTLAATDKLIGASVSGQDDGTVDFAIQAKDATAPTEGEGEITSDPAAGIRVKTVALEGGDQTAVDALVAGFTSGKGKRHDIRVSPREDQTLDAVVVETEIPESPLASQNAGAALLKEVVTGIGNDRDLAASGSGAVAVTGERINFQGRINEDGTISWMRVVGTAVAASASLSGGIKNPDFLLEVQLDQMKNQPIPSASDNDIPDTDGVFVEFRNLVIHDTNLCDYLKVTQTLTIDAALLAGTGIVNEFIWQRRDQSLRTRVWTAWVTNPTVDFIGRAQKRSVQRIITRTYAFAMADLGDTSDSVENHRLSTGREQMGPFVVHYTDDEYIVLGPWIADDETSGVDANGLYHYTLTLTGST